ncbi:MAG: hypothetical protein JWM68_4760 [Verrucomicrobiales bacterium]|nr:hypothetical protein [Verrucomicrobiales bacterium]
MSLSAKRTRLAAVTKELALDWAKTKESWKDAKSHEFEQKYLQELFAGVDSAMTVLDELDRILAKIKTDCE